MRGLHIIIRFAAMYRRLLSLTCLALLSLAAAAKAQEGPAQQSRASLLVQQRWLKLMVLDGRLAVTAASDSQAAINLGNIRQHFSVSLTQNGAVLDYDLTSPAETLQVHIEGDDQASIRRQFTPPLDSTSGTRGHSASGQIVVEYSQAPQQPLKLTVTDGGESRTVQANSLWHLLMFEPELSNRYLVPVLEMLRPDWQLIPTADELKKTLLQVAHADQAADRPRWAALVKQLADDHYAVRQRAERQLRAAGRAALPYLQSLSRSDLDAEQWRRVSEIITASIDDREDTPQRMANRLIDDPAVWLGFLADSQQSSRRIAVDRLSALTGAKINFDPAASPETRSGQLAALRARFAPTK